MYTHMRRAPAPCPHNQPQWPANLQRAADAHRQWLHAVACMTRARPVVYDMGYRNPPVTLERAARARTSSAVQPGAPGAARPGVDNTLGTSTRQLKGSASATPSPPLPCPRPSDTHTRARKKRTHACTAFFQQNMKSVPWYPPFPVKNLAGPGSRLHKHPGALSCPTCMHV